MAPGHGRLAGALAQLAGTAALVAMAAGCVAPELAPAPFPARSDTTQPGSLLGPFDGRVTDVASGHPLSGAVVWVSYSFCRGEVLCTPTSGQTWSGETDADGRYVVPQLSAFPPASRLQRTTLVVYKRGYLGYRSDRYFESARPRHDFAQQRNLVKLDRYPEGVNHVEHLAFLGGAGPLRAALRAEGLQTSYDAGSGSTTSSFDASTLLSVEEVRQATGSTDDFTTERLADRKRTARYDSLHFKSVTRGEEGDAAIRIFLYGTDAEAEKNFEEFAPSLPNAKAVDPVPDGLGARVALAQDGEGERMIFGLIVLDRTERAVVLVTCGSALCEDAERIQALAKKIIARLPRAGRGPLAPDAPGQKIVAPPTPTHPDQPDPTFKLREPGLHR